MTTETPTSIPLSRGIWASPSPSRSPFTSEASLVYHPATYDSVASSAAEYEAYRSGGIAWGSASSASERRSSHALTEPEGAHRSLSHGPSEFPRRASLNGPPLGRKQQPSAPFLSALSFHQAPKTNFLGPSVSLLDQFSSLADATRQTEMAHRMDNLHVSEVPARYQTNNSSSSSKSTSPIAADARPWTNNAWTPDNHFAHSMGHVPAASVVPVAPIGATTPPEAPNISTSMSSLKSKAPPPRKKDWKRGRRSENPLLEDLRSRNRTLHIEDTLGQVLEVSTDQHGSRFIQEQLALASPETRQRFFEETEPHRLQLMTDVFGNYVIQQLFELGTPAQRTAMVRQMQTRVLGLSLQMYGCRVVQMAIRHSSEPEQIALVNELRAHVVRCIKDHNGNHVIQKAIECVPPAHVHFIYDDLMSRTLELARHTYGCRVVQRILEFGDQKTRDTLLEQLKAQIEQLVEDQYGNYVVQHIVDNGPRSDREWVLNQLMPRLVELSTHKYASNVIEKCFLRGTPRQRSDMVTAILEPDEQGLPAVVTMIRDQYANYVVQKMLDSAGLEDRRRLVAAIKPHIATIKRNFYGKHLSAIEKLLHD